MGQLFEVSFFSQMFPPASKFDPERDIPDLTGRVMIVTGGNTGIGKETIKVLLSKNAKVYMASRSRERAEAAIKELKALTGREAHFLQLDLANLDAITKAANEFKSRESQLHVLFNSGGVMSPPINELTADGYDLQFGTNVLGHAHFTLSLLPLLLEGAKTSPDGKARIINTSSSVAYFVGEEGVRYDTLRDSPQRTKMGTRVLYSQSKFVSFCSRFSRKCSSSLPWVYIKGVVLFNNELARRYADQGIVANAVNPGNLKTELQRHASSVGRSVMSTILYPAPMGALTQLWAGVSPETRDLNGEFLIPWARIGTAGKFAKMPGEGERLWKWVEEQRKGR
ncbi:hypothetical protein FRC03_003035 [Tulasnella sp. 419]|nr:hypothetical protein FRC03_003035 [Tulasnella sp. 419]